MTTKTASGQGAKRGPSKPATAPLPKTAGNGAARAQQAQRQLSDAVEGGRPSGNRNASGRPAGNRPPAAPAGPTQPLRPQGLAGMGQGQGQPGKKRPAGPRKVRLAVGKIDPWSVMKLSFLMSIALGIALVVAAVVLWFVLDATGVFDTLTSTLSEIAGSESAATNITDLFSLNKVVAVATVLAVVDVILITALSTLMAFLYNLGSTMVGGIGLTLTDD